MRKIYMWDNDENMFMLIFVGDVIDCTDFIDNNKLTVWHRENEYIFCLDRD